MGVADRLHRFPSRAELEDRIQYLRFCQEAFDITLKLIL